MILITIKGNIRQMGNSIVCILSSAKSLDLFVRLRENFRKPQSMGYSTHWSSQVLQLNPRARKSGSHVPRSSRR